MDQKIYGHWLVPSNGYEFEGNLVVNKDQRGLFLELLIPAAKDGGPTVGIRRGTRVPFIQGSLFGDEKIVLYNCVFLDTNGFIGNVLQLVRCEYAFEGLNVGSENQLVFSDAFILFSGMLEWTRLCSFKPVFNRNNSRSIEWHREESVELCLEDGLTLTFSPDISSHYGPYEQEASMSQSVITRFKYKKPISWEHVMQDSKKVRYLCSFALRDYAQIEGIRYLSPSLYEEKNTESAHPLMPQSVLFGSGKDNVVNPSPGRGFFSLFGFQEGINNGAIQKWFAVFERLEPILDLYFSVLEGIVRAPAFQFLNLVQALETFHARFVTNDVQEAIIKANALQDEHAKNNSYKIDFLIKPEQSGGRKVHLYTRLAYLSYDCANYPWRFTEYLGKEKAFLTKIVDSRNYFTHYSETKKDKAFKENELTNVNKRLVNLLQYHILKELGFDDDGAYEKVF